MTSETHFGNGDGLGEEGVAPGLIALMLDGKKPQRLKAFDQLAEERLVHQGTPWPAALGSVPLLLAALDAPKCLGRSLALHLLGHIAVGVPQYYAQTSTAAETLAALKEAADLFGACYRAVAAGAARYLALLDHKDAEVRGAAAMPLALAAPQQCMAALARKLPEETSEETIDAWFIALAVASKCAGVTTEVPERNEASVQASRAIAEVLCGGALTEQSAKTMGPALSGELAAARTPFGSMQDLCIAAALQGGDAGIEMLLKALATAQDHRDALGTALLRGVLVGSRDDGTRVPLRTASTFSQRVVDVVSALPDMTHGPRRHLLVSVGLPSREKDLAPFLGITPKRLTERLLPWRGEQVEIALVMDATARDMATEEEARAAILAAVKPSERVELVQLLAKGAYDLQGLKTWSPQRAVYFLITLLEDPACLPAMEALVMHFNADDYVKLIIWERFIFAVAIHRLRSGYAAALTPVLGFLVEHMWGDFVPLVREVLAAAPADVRDAIILTSPLPSYVSKPGRMAHHTKGVVCQGWFVLDLAATREKAAQRAVAHIAEWKAFPERAERVWSEPLKRWEAPANAWEHLAPVEQAVAALRGLLPEAKAAIGDLGSPVSAEARAVFDQVG